MWSSLRWIVKLVKFIRADSWGSDESKHETLLGEDCGGGRFDLWNRKGGVELSWVESRGVDERKDIQSLTCHHKLSTTHLASGLRPFCPFLFWRIKINCHLLWSWMKRTDFHSTKFTTFKSNADLILSELCNPLVGMGSFDNICLEIWIKWQIGSLCWIVKVVEIWTHYQPGCVMKNW